MNVVDSSGWLEYFAEGPNVDLFAPAIENTSDLIVPSLSLYEVFKRVLQQRGEGDALQAIAVMIRCIHHLVAIACQAVYCHGFSIVCIRIGRPILIFGLRVTNQSTRSAISSG